MNASHAPHTLPLTSLASALFSCMLVIGCGGGSGGAATSGSQSVTPSTPGASVASSTDAASSPATASSAASSADTSAAAASSPAVEANTSKSGEAAANPSANTTSTAKTPSPAPAPAPAAAPAPVAVISGSTSATGTSTTPPAPAATETATASATASPAAEASAGNAPCSVALSKTFGEACYAAASANLSSGGSVSFPNARAGYRGSITATCNNGSVTWSAGSCSYIASVPKATGAAAASATAVAPLSNSYRIGTYYFPGWKNNQVGNARAQPWDVIKLYTDREPTLGWYAEDGTGVMSQQLKWMSEYGIDYVVFDWYWGADNKPQLTAGINAYLGASDRHGVEFSILWSNHTTYTFSKTQFEALFNYWTTNYFKRSNYVKIDGKPVVFIFSSETLDNNAKAIGMTTPALVELAQSIAKANGLPGVIFLGAGTGSAYNYASSSGYQGFSVYNYHSPVSIALTPSRPENVSRTYAELDTSYQNQWAWMQKNASGIYVVPMTSGWDKRPWGGSKDPLHDDSRSTPGEFRNHLIAARNYMDKDPTFTRRMGVICCWNEFGEGSFIEPTKVDGTKYLEQIRDVFGTN